MVKEKKQTVLHEFQLLSREKGKCSECGRETDMLNVDHIIPASILVEMGLPEERYNDRDNFQLLCRLCNTGKGSRLDYKNPKTIPLLEKYLGLIKKYYEKV